MAAISFPLIIPLLGLGGLYLASQATTKKRKHGEKGSGSSIYGSISSPSGSSSTITYVKTRRHHRRHHKRHHHHKRRASHSTLSPYKYRRSAKSRKTGFLSKFRYTRTRKTVGRPPARDYRKTLPGTARVKYTRATGHIGTAKKRSLHKPTDMSNLFVFYTTPTGRRRTWGYKSLSKGWSVLASQPTEKISYKYKQFDQFYGPVKRKAEMKQWLTRTLEKLKARGVVRYYKITSHYIPE